jgi:hypothetical protein
MNHFILFIFLTHFLLGCVSVNVGPKQPKKSENVSFIAPASPYKEIRADNADKIWQSSKTGNTISYLSECNMTVDPTLQVIETEFLSALNSLVINKSEQRSFNEREAKVTNAFGKVDGVDVAISILVFKKNNCNYTISYVGKKTGFEPELSIFENFLKNFRAD